MPANLPPQFFQLQKKLNSTSDIEEKISILKEMLAVCPKHKGTERVQEEIKRKIAKLKKEEPKKIKKETLYFVKKEGAAQVVILGKPNAGKTTLLNSLCKTSFKVAPYPFTTKFPQPGMMSFEDIKIQIVDMPPVSKDFKPGWMKNLAKSADLLLVVLNSKEKENDLKEILEILREWEIEKEKMIIFENRFEKVKEKEIEDLKKRIFNALAIIRVYTKEPREKVKKIEPFILKKGTKLIELAERINENFAKTFKGAKLYSQDLKTAKLVGRDYILKDGDIVEIKT
jgi:small GTP-binding protein